MNNQKKLKPTITLKFPLGFKKVLCPTVLLIISIGLLLIPTLSKAQSYEILILGGHVIDVKNNIDEIMDVAISEGKIAKVAANIPPSSAEKVIDAKGLFVTPGFIDIHSHNYHGTDPHSEYSNGLNALRPDEYNFRSGVTTVVDVGGSGWRNFLHFKEQVIDRSKTRVLAFLNIVGHGMKGHPWEQNLNDMDPKMTALLVSQYSEIVGVKLAHYNGHDWEPIDRLIAAGIQADVPVMVDFGSAAPPLSLETLVMEKFRPGDIYTHMYGGGGSGREAVLDGNFDLRPGMIEAQKRGVIFDVGHGGASFFYKIAIPAMKQGLLPNTISTDGHVRSMMSGMKDMANVMSKFLNLGMSLKEVVAASTWKPANVIKQTALGHLSEGTEADVTVFNIRKGDFAFIDRTGGDKMIGNQKLEIEMTLRAGQIVWDLNGLAEQELQY